MIETGRIERDCNGTRSSCSRIIMSKEILTSENSPELKKKMERLSSFLLKQNREAYSRLARFDD